MSKTTNAWNAWGTGQENGKSSIASSLFPSTGETAAERLRKIGVTQQGTSNSSNINVANNDSSESQRTRSSSAQSGLSTEESAKEGGNGNNKQAKKKTTGPVHNSRYKAKMCKNWMKNGSCPYFEKCQFAHGSYELEKWANRRARLKVTGSSGESTSTNQEGEGKIKNGNNANDDNGSNNRFEEEEEKKDLDNEYNGLDHDTRRGRNDSTNSSTDGLFDEDRRVEMDRRMHNNNVTEDDQPETDNNNTFNSRGECVTTPTPPGIVTDASRPEDRVAFMPQNRNQSEESLQYLGGQDPLIRSSSAQSGDFLPDLSTQFEDFGISRPASSAETYLAGSHASSINSSLSGSQFSSNASLFEPLQHHQGQQQQQQRHHQQQQQVHHVQQQQQHGQSHGNSHNISNPGFVGGFEQHQQSSSGLSGLGNYEHSSFSSIPSLSAFQSTRSEDGSAFNLFNMGSIFDSTILYSSQQSGMQPQQQMPPRQQQQQMHMEQMSRGQMPQQNMYMQQQRQQQYMMNQMPMQHQMSQQQQQQHMMHHHGNMY